MATNDVILTINDLNAVLEDLFDARAQWKNIGSGIGVDAGTLETMKGKDSDCLRDTLSHWLKGVYKSGEPNSKPRTWTTLIAALRAKVVNQEAMANKLQKEKCPDTNQVASGSTNGASVSSTSGGNTSYPCTPANLEIELKQIAQPYQFGLHLGVDPTVLQHIEKDYPGNVARQRTEVIIYWDRNYECTWEKVADALEKLGGYGKLEKRLRQMHTGSGPSSSPSAPPKLKEDKLKAPLEFSNNLSPNDLVAWLSQELVTRSLKLDQAVKDKLIEEEINGEAFKDLSREDLEKMGFKMGPCKNIMKIIKDLK